MDNRKYDLKLKKDLIDVVLIENKSTVQVAWVHNLPESVVGCVDSTTSRGFRSAVHVLSVETSSYFSWIEIDDLQKEKAGHEDFNFFTICIFIKSHSELNLPIPGYFFRY